MERIRSTQIREDLGIDSKQEFVEDRYLAWSGILQRMNIDKQVKQIWRARPINNINKTDNLGQKNRMNSYQKDEVPEIE